MLENRAVQALAAPANWVQLAKFGVVGASGYVINLAVYVAAARLGPHPAAAISFVVAAASNYWWNRHWTFAERRGTSATRGCASSSSRSRPSGSNQLWLLVFLDWLGSGKVVSQAIAIVLVTPLNFLGNKLWSFRR